MFDWFKNIGRRGYSTGGYASDMEKISNDMNKVIPFPEPKSVPPVPEVIPPKEEKPAIIYYRLGTTSNNRVSLSMGYSEITLNAGGINNLIKQLEAFRDQLHDEDEDDEEDEQ
jgi:hypothetical protein